MRCRGKHLNPETQEWRYLPDLAAWYLRCRGKHLNPETFIQKEFSQFIKNKMRLPCLAMKPTYLKLLSLALSSMLVAASPFCGARLTLANGLTPEQLVEAIKTGLLTQVPLSELVTLVENADTIGLGLLCARIRTIETNLTIGLVQGKLTEQEFRDAFDNLKNLEARAIKAKNPPVKPQHPDQGEEPFFGIFTSDISLEGTLPSDVTLTLNPEFSASFIVGPKIWGNEIANPSVIEAQITAQVGSEQFELTNFNFILDSFNINGAPSGQNLVSIRPSSDTRFEFNPVTDEFDAFYEGLLTNDLYPETNPILFFSQIRGTILSETEVLVSSGSEPMIVPGVPGEPPVDQLGMAYTATVATFDPINRLLTFGDNIDESLIPDVSVVRTPDGTYLSETEEAEPLIGASFEIEPLKFLGQDSRGRYLFADSEFSIFNLNGTFASGRFTGINIDPSFFSFTADVEFNNLSGMLPSPFIDRWLSAPQIQLLGPVATNVLIQGTENFTQSGSSPTDFINSSPRSVPEPTSTLSFLTLGTLGIGSVLKRKK